ncbi:hypothetical protein PIB30_081483 [Stylosanthes scabra]|uniref:Uncharacterized protein n=1 Tax=Stylosanthes scabra TaxID=79078 RepID=A0ABU6SRV7_9FABA|nr:hypothetical protein [Stylosanthes scabra]
MEILQSASSEATLSKLPSELQFEWVNFSNLNSISPQHYGLLETDGQLKALCGVMDKKEMDSLGLDESRFITCEKPKICSRHFLKLYNNRGKVGAFSLRKHLEPCQFQEKLEDSQNNGWTNQVWDPGKSYKKTNATTKIGGNFKRNLSINPLDEAKQFGNVDGRIRKP